MAEWTHRICERCWFDDENLSTTDDGAYRTPVQVINPETKVPDPGVCCTCGGLTITGIYMRKNENDLLCKGRHGEDQIGSWSQVGVAST